ncbi:unnamed protein product [Brassica oleracea]|uniref:Uncharacterized protein n=1 Tax=Brassica oleracea TaxID=3712 RepID=A0A3P6G1K3_BRAOL|nr:unnamed protein product [Brassica oleracea]
MDTRNKSGQVTVNTMSIFRFPETVVVNTIGGEKRRIWWGIRSMEVHCSTV